MTRPAPRESRTAADAIALLEKDHREVEALFERLKAAKGAASRLKVLAALKDALVGHGAVEDEIFYPAVRTTPSEEAQVLVSNAEEDHHVIKTLLADLDATTPDAETFLPAVLALEAAVKTHVELEEESLLPAARKLLGAERLRALGDRMAAGKPKPKAPEPKTLEKVAR